MDDDIRPTPQPSYQKATPDNQTTPSISVSSDSSSSNTSHRGIVITILVLLLVAALGAAAYIFLGKDKAGTAATSAVTKKDIPNVRYVTNNSGWDLFYPVSENTSSYNEANLATFEGLVRYENKTQIVPLLATGWTNPDSTTWVFNLKKGVKFHSGREMTAEDVKASFEKAKTEVAGEIFASTIKSVEVNGPYKVTIKTDGPDPTLLKKLVNYYVFDTKSGKDNDPINGTGPFVMKAGTKPAAESLELTAFDGYHGGRLNVRSLSFIALDGEDRGEAFNANKGDITDSPPLAITREHVSLTVEPNAVFLLPLNTKRVGSPLQNQKVREAIHLATDPAPLAKVRGEDPLPASQLMPSSIPGYNPDVIRPARDIVKAKQLLKEAGYPNGFTITFTYYGPSQSTADEISRQLAEAGIKLKQDPQTDVKILGQKAATGGTDMYFQTYATDILDASDTLAVYSDTANYTNAKVVKLLGDAQNTFDSSKRLGFLQEASKEMSTDLGVVPVYTPKSTPISHNKNLVIQRDINSSNLLGIYWFKVYAK